MARRLAGTLRVAPEDLPRFVAFARAELDDEYYLPTHTVEFGSGPAPAAEPEPLAAPPAPAPHHNLPTSLTRFFGRETEITQLARLLAENRLVTISGPAGVGKTRLALLAAEAALARYADGVWLAELAPVADPAQVLDSVARALGARRVQGRPLLETLSRFLHARQPLLVLDNCEHVLDACAWLAADLLRACPRLTILATSREPLGLPGEAVYLAPALPLPGAGERLSPEAVSASPAVRLFIDRARMVHPDYQITAENATWLARICRRLDGLPLAIEMAAARMNLLTAEQLAGRLDDAFGVLTHGSRAAPARQQTLRATLDWSYNLLSEPERLLLRRLALFAGGCTLEAAEAVCAGDGLAAGSLLETLTALVTKSMVIADRRLDEETRYRLLDIVRQYIRATQPSAADDQRLRLRHYDFFLSFAQRHGLGLWSKDRMFWLAKFDAEHDNLLAALAWGYAHHPDPAAGPRLTVALHAYWHRHALEEAWHWFQKAAARCQADASLPPLLQAQVFSYGSIYRLGYDPVLALELARRGLAVSRALGPAERGTLAQALILFIENATSRYLDPRSPKLVDEAWGALDELRALVPRLEPEPGLDPRFYRARAAGLLAQAECARGAYPRARAAALESLRLFGECAHEENLIWPYGILGDIALASGAARDALDYYLQAHRLAVPNDHVHQGDILAVLCAIALRLNDPAQALGYCQEYIRLAYAKDTPFNVAERLEMMARILAWAGRAGAAARLSGAAEALSEKIGRKISPVWPHPDPHGDWTTRHADVSLDALVPDWHTRPDAAAIQQAWRDGRALSYEAVVAEALAAIFSDGHEAPPG